MITSSKLKPLKGYRVKCDSEGVHYYESIEKKFVSNNIVIKESENWIVPNSRNNRFKITLVGGGGAFNIIDGQAGSIHNIDIILNAGDEIQISIGKAGTTGSGGTTSFGTYAQAIGGAAGAFDGNDGYDYMNTLYGRGASETSSATDGICIIEYIDPVKTRRDKIYARNIDTDSIVPDPMTEEEFNEYLRSFGIDPETINTITSKEPINNEETIIEETVTEETSDSE